MLAAQADRPSGGARLLQRRRVTGFWTVAVAALVAVVPAAAAETPSNVTRIAGANRYATAAAFATDRWDPGVSVAYVVNGTSFADALASAPAAAAGGGPVVLTSRDELPPETADALRTLRPATINVAGGTAAVSDAVVAKLREFTAGAVTRIAGDSRYETAAAIARHAFESLDSNFAWTFVTSGESYPDALGGAAAASASPESPLLLTQRDVLPAATESEIRRLAPDRIYVIGGTAVVSDAVVAKLRGLAAEVVRIAGVDRYATAANVAIEIFASRPEIVVTTGTNFADGLVGAAYGAPLLLLPRQSVPQPVFDAIEDLEPIRATVLGGTAAVTDEQARIIGEAIEGLR